MRRGLILASDGWAGSGRDGLLRRVLDLAGRPSLVGARVGFIVNASDYGRKGTSRLVRRRLQELGADVVPVDLRRLDVRTVDQTLRGVDILNVEGGNTFYLMALMKTSGLAEVLPSHLSRIVYVGTSAGAIVASPSVVTALLCRDLPLRPCVGGMGLIPDLLWPHFDQRHEKALRLLQRFIRRRVRTLRDGQFLVYR